MDQSIRNKLRNVVTQCRKLLEEAVSQVLQGQFGIHASGKKDEVHVEDEGRMKNLSEEDKGYRRDIIAHLEHIQALGYKAKDALAQLVREIAFTHLNRLCAYKMMEAREVWVGGQRFREAVSRGMKSQGFQFYLADHGDDKKLFDAGHQDVAYRHFLGWMGALLSEEIGVLFSPTDPANRLFPPQRVLDDVLALLNSDDLKDIWAEDETIGWVYQYFTPKELRDQVRKESAAPRNSYELAFRNQFFTPRYVVEFLTDNTLGRIWYEMRKGDTKLKDQCRYMVRRPSEAFLAEGQSPPESPQGQEELSQEELLKQPVHIPHRAKKDPRELRILDPACGSGHFLLYCFDLLLTIYEEAYADPDLDPMLKEDYPTLDALRRDVPRLILAHNLHGIDIDLRASQIAALALWLRCQRAYREMGLKQDRPRIRKSNIVCAEPMPGEKTLLDEFLKTLKQDRLETLIRRVMQVPEGTRVRATESMAESLNELVRLVWDKMQLAGEAGSLLKIEEELSEAVRMGQEEWEEKLPLFRFTEFSLTEKPKESYLRFVPGEGVSFWQRAEALVLEALRDYARHAANGGRLQRQLFADDAERGFAFVDMCQKRFDVLLMNPPFGSATVKTHDWFMAHYPTAAENLTVGMIVEGMNRLAPGGAVGLIGDLPWLQQSTYVSFRTVLLAKRSLQFFVELGWGILGTDVEVCLSVFSTQPQASTLFSNVVGVPDQASALLHTFSSPGSFRARSLSDFTVIENHPFAYQISDHSLAVFRERKLLATHLFFAAGGVKCSDADRVFRCWFEVPVTMIGKGKEWAFCQNGSPYCPYYYPTYFVIRSDGGTFDTIMTYPTARIPNRERYWQPGLAYGKRTWEMYCYPMPSEQVITQEGNALFPIPTQKQWHGLAIGNSSLYSILANLVAGQHKYAGYLNTICLDNDLIPDLGERALEIYRMIKKIDALNELSHAFDPSLLVGEWGKIDSWLERLGDLEGKIQQAIISIDECVYAATGETMRSKRRGPSGGSYFAAITDLSPSQRTLVEFSLSMIVGVLCGRWDVRCAIKGRHVPRSEDAFAPLDAHTAPMLRNHDESALSTEVRDYPVTVDVDGIIPDDPDHSDDIVRRVREVLELIWKDHAEAIEKEACEILGVKELRDYFRKPGKGGFWDDHVSRYSKSRRKAPIYWLLQSSKKNYSLWLYYHRLDKDILFKARQNYVEPKIRLVESHLSLVRGHLQKAKDEGKGTKDRRKLEKEVERAESLAAELKDFAEKLERAAKLNFGNPEKLNSEVVYDPDLNDGVVLTIAPLWELVPWKEAKNYWEELLEGKYEWSSMGKLLRKKGLVK